METCDQLEFDVVEVADTMGWQLPIVKRGLRQLQWSTDRGVCECACLHRNSNFNAEHFGRMFSQNQSKANSIVKPSKHTAQYTC